MKTSNVNADGYVITKKQGIAKASLATLARSIKVVNWFTDAELMQVPSGSYFVFDVETYRNFWFVAFKHIESGKVVAFETSPLCELNTNKLRWMLWRFCIVGFNSRMYDIPMICLALEGKTPEQLKAVSDRIIREELRAYNIEKEYKIKIPNINHIDLIEVAPLKGSLKLYAGRLHCSRLQDLPIQPDADLTEDEAVIVRLYCANDLDNTELLFTDLWQQLELRMQMSKEYGIDLRSKSDAQLAEAVINSELAKLTGSQPRKPTLAEGALYRYDVPAFIQYQTPALQDALEAVRAAEFELDISGSPIAPKSLEGRLVRIGDSIYKMGMGGLHSQEKETAHIATNEVILSDNDVESFYPKIILNQRLFPSHLGEAFLQVYESLVTRRLQAKKTKNKAVADSLKITINGSFGKLGNKYSTLYAPQLLLQVTITGQLVLLMLIEMLELADISVVSGNTDGIVLKYNKAQHETARRIITEWEQQTDFKTEETRYAAIYSRDINNYIAAKLKFNEANKTWQSEIENCKVKGAYSEKGSALNSVLSKNPEALICSDAVQALIKCGTPIEQTITQCRDIRRFVTVRNVKGGAEKAGVYLGRVVRWYYATGECGQINYVLSGNKVAKTDGGKPLMDLPPQFPTDINYNWYIEEAKKILFEIGYLQKIKTQSLF